MIEIIEFVAIINKNIVDKNNFKVYATNPITNKEKLKFNQYGNVSISGNLPNLVLGMPYSIKGIETQWGYNVINIEKKENNENSNNEAFLRAIITEKQANTLLSVYPNIVNKIITNNLNDINLNKTKGIKKTTFNIIRNKVIKNAPLLRFMEKFSDYNITISNAKKMYEFFTCVEKAEEMMIKDPYATLCSISGISFKTADSKILSHPKNKCMENSLQRMSACINFCLKENNKQGNTWISLDDLLEMTNKLTPQCIQNYFLKALDRKDIYIEKNKKRIAFKRDYLIEKYISQQLIKLLKHSQSLNIDYDKYCIVDGIELTAEQKNTLKNFCKYNVSVLVGNAGTGKSQTVASVIQLCDDNNISYMLATPTGKSAQVLSDFTEKEAGTIHRNLCYNPSRGWKFNENNKIKQDVVIVDENGMTDIYLMKHLLEATDCYKTKVLFVQDDAQLPSVKAGNCAYDMVNSNILPINRLTRVFRYAEGGLSKIVTQIKNGEKYINNKDCKDIRVYGKNEDYCLIPTKNEYILDYIVGIYKNLIQNNVNPNDIAILSSMNVSKNGCIEINQKIQETFNKYNPRELYAKYGKNVFRQRDIVMQIENNYNAKNEYGETVLITNGEVGRITNIDLKNIYIQFKNNLIKYNKQDDLKQLQLAYAYSIHKSQGSSIPYVILVTPTSHKFILNKNLLYVGMSRTQKKCYHISLPETINFGLKKNAELERNTFLKDLLIEEYKSLS